MISQPSQSSKQDPPSIRLVIERAFPTAVTPTDRVLEVAMMFGLGVDDSRDFVVVPRTEITLTGETITFITGPSGSGKSTVLRLIADTLDEDQCLDFESYLNDDEHDGRDHDDGPQDASKMNRPIIELIGRNVAEATRILSAAGLADAFVMLRSIRELSEGQRYRFALARVMDFVESRNIKSTSRSDQLIVILADEFGASLDRLTASMVARNIRRWINTMRNVALVVATTHDDLLEPLAPDTLIFKLIGRAPNIIERPVGNTEVVGE